jgi:TorA maturation chaperone TorD
MKDLASEPDTAELRRLAAITHGYDYLARIWLDGPLRLADPVLRAWLDDLAPVDPGLAARCAAFVRLLDTDDERTAADEDFQECLVVPQPGRYIPPYASAWTGSPDELWSPTTVSVARCYSQAGLDWQHAANDSDRPWVRAPDHLGIECAFIAELTTASAQRRAREPDRSGPADPGALAASFVIEHMRTWVPAYAAQFIDHAHSRYWQDASDVLVAWLHQDSLLPAEAGRPARGVVSAAVTGSQPAC